MFTFRRCVKCGLCPNCLDFLATKNQMDIEQDQKIKALERRLSNCIEPKFKVGQIVYTYDKYQNCVYSLDIISIHIEKYENPIFSSLVYRAKRLKDSFIYGYLEDELFATKEEAKAKLMEVKDEDKETC